MDQNDNILLALCFELEKEGYHPVLPFGDTSSGKTSVLLSLLAELHNEKIPYRLDLNLLGKDTDICRDVRNFFDYYLFKFIENMPPVGTRTLRPIYIFLIQLLPALIFFFEFLTLFFFSLSIIGHIFIC